MVVKKQLKNVTILLIKSFLEAGLFEVTTFSIFRPLVDGLFFVALIVIFTTTNLIRFRS